MFYLLPPLRKYQSSLLASPKKNLCRPFLQKHTIIQNNLHNIKYKHIITNIIYYISGWDVLQSLDQRHEIKKFFQAQLAPQTLVMKPCFHMLNFFFIAQSCSSMQSVTLTRIKESNNSPAPTFNNWNMILFGWPCCCAADVQDPSKYTSNLWSFVGCTK